MSTIKTETLSTPSNTTVPVDTVVNGTAKAWVNFNGTGTVAIRRAFNVSSITDNGTGDFTVNFSTAMSDANYAVVVGPGKQSNSWAFLYSSTILKTTSQVKLLPHNFSGGSVDSEYVEVAIFS